MTDRLTAGPQPNPDAEEQPDSEAADELIARGNALMRKANEALARARPLPLACIVCGAPLPRRGDIFCSDVCRMQWQPSTESPSDSRE